MEIYNLRKLSELEFRKEYQIKISNRFEVLESLNDSEDINKSWEISEEDIKTSATENLSLYELKQHQPLFDEGFKIFFLVQRKHAKMQWLQDPDKSSVRNLNNVRCEASRHFRNKKKEYLEAKINEIESNSKIKTIRNLYRGIIDFKKGYQPRTNIVKMRRVTLLPTATIF